MAGIAAMSRLLGSVGLRGRPARGEELILGQAVRVCYTEEACGGSAPA